MLTASGYSEFENSLCTETFFCGLAHVFFEQRWQDTFWLYMLVGK
jgi:hypothetical protein